jgi:hypothetical protein
MSGLMRANLYVTCSTLLLTAELSSSLNSNLLYFERIHSIAPMIHKKGQ